MRLHFLLLTACAITSADVSTTGGSTKIEEHSTIHVSHPVVSVVHQTFSSSQNLQDVTSHGSGPVVSVVHRTFSSSHNLQDVSSHGADPVVSVVHQTFSSSRNQEDVSSHGADPVVSVVHRTFSTSQNLQDVSSHGADPVVSVVHRTSSSSHNLQDVSSHGVGPGSDGFPVGGLLGNLMAHAPQDPKHGSGRDSVSEPIIHYSLLVNNTMHITCFSESGPLPLRYKLFINDKLRQEKVVYSPVAANFTISMTPGTQVYLNCTAISPTGEKSSKNETLRVGDPDDSSTTPEEGETDQKDKDTGLEYLIPLQYILTSVTPDVLGRNNLVLIICGPILLVLLVIFIFVSYLRSRKEHHRELETI
ncbi:uncharacterized protein [Engystomops pustulosus]|uniref:uncharacterized protein isoform X3 n=1 Tax=Engystomops pustulosus TaxID=76066 RepID=UPI003AFAA6EF